MNTTLYAATMLFHFISGLLINWLHCWAVKSINLYFMQCTVFGLCSGYTDGIWISPKESSWSSLVFHCLSLLGCDLVIGAVSPVVSSHTKQTTCYNGIKRLLTNTHTGQPPCTRYLLYYRCQRKFTKLHNAQRGTLLMSGIHVYSLSINAHLACLGRFTVLWKHFQQGEGSSRDL